MAKINFSKLGLKKKEDTQIVTIGDSNIEVQQYIPVNNKAAIVEAVLNQSNDSNNFFSPLRLEVYTYMEIIFAYTNLSFTEKQLEDIPKLYDLLDSNGVLTKIISAIPTEEFDFIMNLIESSAEAVTKYHDSFLGMMRNLTSDFEGISGIEDLLKKVQSREGLDLLSEVYQDHGPVQA